METNTHRQKKKNKTNKKYAWDKLIQNLTQICICGKQQNHPTYTRPTTAITTHIIQID